MNAREAKMVEKLKGGEEQVMKQQRDRSSKTRNLKLKFELNLHSQRRNQHPESAPSPSLMLRLHHQHQLHLSVRQTLQHHQHHSPLTHSQLPHPHLPLLTSIRPRAYSTISNVHLLHPLSPSCTHLSSHSSSCGLRSRSRQQQRFSLLHPSAPSSSSRNRSSTTQDARDRLARIRARAAQQEAAVQQPRNQHAVGSMDDEGRFADSQYQPSAAQSFNPLPSGPPSHLPPPPPSTNVPSPSPSFASPLRPGDPSASVPIDPFLPVRGRDEVTGMKRLVGTIDIMSALIIADLLSFEAMNIQMAHIESLFPYFDPLRSVLVMECANIALFGLLFHLGVGIRSRIMKEKLSPPHEGAFSPHDNWFKNWIAQREGPRSRWGNIWRWLAFIGIGTFLIVLSMVIYVAEELIDPRFSIPHREIELSMSRCDERHRAGFDCGNQVILIEFVVRGLVFVQSLRRIGSVLPAYVISALASTLAYENSQGHSLNTDPPSDLSYSFVFRLTRSLFAPMFLHLMREPLRYLVPSFTSPMYSLTEQQDLQTLASRLSVGLQKMDVDLIFNVCCQFNILYRENSRDIKFVRSVISSELFLRWWIRHPRRKAEKITGKKKSKRRFPFETQAEKEKEAILQALIIADSSLLTPEMVKEIDSIFAALDRKEKGHLSLIEWTYLASLDSRRHDEFNSACQIIATAPEQKDAKSRLLNDKKDILVTFESVEQVPRRTITPINMNEINIAQPYESVLSSLPVVSDISVPPLSILPYWQQRQQSDMSMEKVSLFEQIRQLFVNTKEEKKEKANVESVTPPSAKLLIDPHPSSRLTSAEQRTRAENWYSIRHTIEYETLFHYDQIRAAHDIDWNKAVEVTQTIKKSLLASWNEDAIDDVIREATNAPAALSNAIQPSLEKLAFELNGCTRQALTQYVLKELRMRPQQTVEWLKRAHKVIAGQEAHPTQAMWKARTSEKKT